MRSLRTARAFALLVGTGALGGIALPALVAGQLPGAPPAGSGGGVAVLSLRAAPAYSGASVGRAEARAVSLLRRAAVAGRVCAYSGTQFVTSWSTAGTSSVIVSLQHLPGRGVLVRLSGEEAAETVGDPAGAAVDPWALALLERHYTLSVVDRPGQSAGRTARVVEARPRGVAAVAGRFWLDQATGLVLRRELYDRQGRTVRAVAFLDVEMSVPLPWSASGRSAASGTGSPLTAGQIPDLRSAGWQVPNRLSGGLELFDARRRDGVLHLSYTDGLFAVSMFSQRGRLDRHSVKGWQPVRVAGTPAWTRPGLSRRVVWSGDGWVHTAVADAPDPVVTAAVTSFAVSPHESFRHRIGRGLDRMGSWLDPTS